MEMRMVMMVIEILSQRVSGVLVNGVRMKDGGIKGRGREDCECMS